MGSTQEQTTYYLVTGSNNGLGLGSCKRILTTFLTTRPATHRIHLVASTRSRSKSAATLERLRGHLQSSTSLKAAAEARVTLSSIEMDLTDLRSVLAAAKKLHSELPRLDVLLCNAGISGNWIIDWPQAVWDAMFHPISSVTWPRFFTEPLARAASQFPASVPAKIRNQEPPLGEVFTANVFGHYLLVRHLRDLLAGNATSGKPPGRVVWVSTHDTETGYFTLDDMQCLNTHSAYRSSKCLTDLLCLTMSSAESRPSVSSYLSPLNEENQPRFYLSHPGVVNTSIHPLGPIMKTLKLFAFYYARMLGSPWHPIDVHRGSSAACWLALAPLSTLEGIEERDGKGKWGAGTDRWGNEKVSRTEVEGWGFDGKIGSEERWAPKRFGRAAWSKDLTAQDKKEFLELGGKAWQEMERLRVLWEGLLVKVDKLQNAR